MCQNAHFQQRNICIPNPTSLDRCEGRLGHMCLNVPQTLRRDAPDKLKLGELVAVVGVIVLPVVIKCPLGLNLSGKG